MGVILRGELDPAYSVLTPWPGAIGYLSRLHVADALGRTTPAGGTARTRSWTGRPRVDIVAALRAGPDYILPVIRVGAEVPAREAVAQAWTRELDLWPADPARQALVAAELEPYEMLVVPVQGPGIRPGVFPENRFFLLRRRALGLAPRLFVIIDGNGYRIEVEHRSHAQLVDLRLSALDADGRTFAITPSGELVDDPRYIARSAILLLPTGARRIELMRGTLPPDAGLRALSAQLSNPQSPGKTPFSIASEEVSVRLTP